MEIITLLIALVVVAINWAASILIITILVGTVLPVFVSDSVDSKIEILNFTLVHVKKQNNKIKLSLFKEIV